MNDPADAQVSGGKGTEDTDPAEPDAGPERTDEEFPRPSATPASADTPPVTGNPVTAGLRGAVTFVRELLLVVVVALGLSLLLKTFLVQAFSIPSQSMEDTLREGDRVLVTKLNPGPLDLRRGDVVVFKDPGRWLLGTAEPEDTAVRSVLTFVGLLPADAGQHLIKRVVGLPGDTVACCDTGGRLTVNGTPVQETYLKPGSTPSQMEFTVTVPPGRLWVMGDNRQHSRDSRFNRDNHDGTVPVDNVVGRAFGVVWPLQRLDWLDRPRDAFDEVPAR